MIIVIIVFKVIKSVLSIFPFASCAGSSVSFIIDLKCSESSIIKVQRSYSYPFVFKDEHIKFDNCDGQPRSYTVPGNFSSQSEYYVAIGVLCFIYSLLALGVYIFCDNLYRSNDKLPIADFLITAFLCVMWLVSSSVWASGISNMKTILDKEYLTKQVEPLKALCNEYQCTMTEGPNFASENISVIFGFLNLLVWGGNLWFLYKETAWFKVRSRPPDDQTVEPQKA